jgi:signal transduction histidine kinase
MSAHAAGGAAGDAHAAAPQPVGASLISHFGHALRTPLNAMLGLTQILTLDRSQPLSPVQKEWVDQIEAAGWQLARLIDDAVDLARIATGNLAVSMQPVAVQALLRDCVAQIGTDAQERVRIEAAAEATVWADPLRLKQALVNLLRASLQSGRGGSEIRVGVRDATIRIRDGAQSLTEEQAERMFLPLDHPAADRAGVRSVQLGLALTQKLVELMGGRLQVHREPGSGHELQLRLGTVADAGAPARLAGAA